MANFTDGFFKKIEKKTNVNKETILDLAKKLQENDLKNENTLREVIQELSSMTGKEVSKEKEDKIINAVINDNVPKNIDKMF
jgi:cell shape-determining protein MreC